MRVKIHLAWMVVAVALSILSISGLASSRIEQPPMTPYMRGAVGTPDELSPLAPAEARRVRKVGNRWTCEINGQLMFYNDATSRWEPQGQDSQKK